MPPTLRPLLLAGIALALASPARAEEPALAPPPPPAEHGLQAILEAARRIQHHAAGDPASIDLEALLATRDPAGPDRSSSPLPGDAVWQPVPGRVHVLMSEQLGAVAVRQLLAEIVRDGDAVAVWRGLLPGETIGDAVRRIAAHGREAKTTMAWQGIQPGDPPQEIDPRPFRTLAQPGVPVMIHLGPDGTWTQAQGLAVIGAFRAQIASRPGSSQAYGDLVPVAEREIVDVARERLNPERLRERMAASAEGWLERQRFVELEPASEDRVRLLDPTVTVQTDLAAPDGRLVARAGERINPLDKLPFPDELLVFDPGREAELSWLQSRAPVRPRSMLIATRLSGWKELATLEERLDAPVYLLTPELRDRFALERTPTSVTAEGRRFRIDEQAVSLAGASR